MQKINEFKNNISLTVNSKLRNKEVDVVPVAVPRRFNRDFKAETVDCNSNDHFSKAK
jgi:hypothetical protein